MRVIGLLTAAIAAGAQAVPGIRKVYARQNATTASQRLGLEWLGGNSSLPKIL